MSRIHIALVGGQPAPVYHGIVAIKPDKVIYIYSENTHGGVKKLDAEIKIPAEYIELDVTLPNKIKKCAEDLAEKYKEDEVTVNISSGLKSWSHWFGVIFDKYPNAAVVYMDQNNVLWNYKTMQSSQDFEFDMHTHFRLYGNSIEDNYKKFSEYTEKDFEALQVIEKARRFDVNIFNDLLSLLDKKKQNTLKTSKFGKFEHPSDSFVEWERATNEQDGFIRIFINKKNGKREEFKCESPNVVDMAFNSGWFEYKVASLLSKWKRCKELCMNCRFPFNPQVDKNETDIIINTGSKVLFVECKTQIKNTTDIDKFRSVIKGYGGMGSKGLFITDAPMTNVAREKCNEHGILAFSLQDDYPGMSLEKALFLLLDTQLYNINTK